MAKLSNDSRLKRLSNQYRLVIMNDDTYEEMATFKLSRLSVYIGFSTLFIVLISVTMSLVIFTPLKYYIPGYGSHQSRAELDLLKIRTDSLEQGILYKEQYLEAVKKVLNGSSPTQRDTLPVPVPKQEISNY